MKKCNKCGEVKPVSEFNKRPSSRDGLRSECKVCRAAYKRKHYLANREAIRAKHRDYYIKHSEEIRARVKIYGKEHRAQCAARNKAYRIKYKEKFIAYDKAYRAKHKQRIKAVLSKWHKDNPEKVREAKFRRRAHEHEVSGYATAEQVAARREVFGNRCYICGEEAEAMDHVKPLAKGGANWPCNLRPICKLCNCSKQAKWPFDIEAARIETMGDNGR